MAKNAKFRNGNAGNVVGAGAAGGGIGTALAALAASLPHDNSYKSLLTVSAPLISVGISGCWLFIKRTYIDPYRRRRDQEAADKWMDWLVATARKKCQQASQDPNASEQHKRELRKILEDLEKLQLEKISESMQVLGSN